MRIWLKNVTQSWLDVVQTLASPDELAIWQASGYRAWRIAQPGDLVLFRPEGRARVVAGHGIYVETTLHFARDAHALFGGRLGVDRYDDLPRQVDARRVRPGGPNPVIATMLIKDPNLFPSAWPFELPWPIDAADVMVPLCSGTSLRGRTLLAGLRDHARPRGGAGEVAQQALVDPGRVRSRAHRPGWSTLRSMTMRLYGHRCAITGDRVSAVHDVIHLRPRNKGGADVLGNLMTARTDLHRLVERGLLALDRDYRVMLSGQSSLFEETQYLKLDGLRASSSPLRPPLARRGQSAMAAGSVQRSALQGVIGCSPHADHVPQDAAATRSPRVSVPACLMRARSTMGIPSPARAGEGGTTQS